MVIRVDLKNVLGCFIYFELGDSWALFAQMPLTLCVKPTEDWKVLEVRSRKVIHLFIDL